jgi:hypothetical protein
VAVISSLNPISITHYLPFFLQTHCSVIILVVPFVDVVTMQPSSLPIVLVMKLKFALWAFLLQLLMLQVPPGILKGALVVLQPAMMMVLWVVLLHALQLPHGVLQVQLGVLQVPLVVLVAAMVIALRAFLLQVLVLQLAW